MSVDAGAISEARAIIFTLAKNAGTQVNQEERFSARILAQSVELARNIRSFGDEA